MGHLPESKKSEGTHLEEEKGCSEEDEDVEGTSVFKGARRCSRLVQKEEGKNRMPTGIKFIREASAE